MEKPMVERILTAMLCRARQCWEQGIAGVAAVELGREDLLIPMCDDMLTRQAADGRLCIVEHTDVQTDPALCVRPLLEAAKRTGEARYREAAVRNIAFLLRSRDQTPDGVLWHIMGLPEIWADSAAMAPSSLALLGYKDEAIAQLEGICRRLRLPNGLYAHRWDESKGDFARAKAWGAGNGWILTGLSWTLAALGADDPRTERLLRLYRELETALESRRTPSGLFRDILDDPDSFEECQTAAMLAYSRVILYENGWPRADALQAGWNTLETIARHADAAGTIHDCPGSPSFEENGTSTEMQAFWLMLYGALQRNTGTRP